MEVKQHYQNEIISITNAELIPGYIKKIVNIIYFIRRYHSLIVRSFPSYRNRKHK